MIIFIIIAVVSGFGLLWGITILAWTGEYGWIALIVGSVAAIIGAVFGIFRILLRKRITTTKREKESL